MLVVELVIALLAIFPGVRLGGIGIDFASGLGVLVLVAIGVRLGNIPFDAISIITAAIAAISAMQATDGLDYLVHQIEKLLRRSPKYVAILALTVTYFLTTFAGTGNISLATLLVTAEVTKEQGIKLCRPLSTAVISARIAITASPISAVVVYMSSVMKGHGISYLHLLSVVIPSTLLAVLVMFFLVTMLSNSKLSDDPIYRKRLEEGLVELYGEKQTEIRSGARTSIWLFLLGMVGMVIYAIIDSPNMDLTERSLVNIINAALIIILSTAALTTVIYKVDIDNILSSSAFKAGMSVCICILGIVWLGDAFVSNNINWIKDIAGEVIQGYLQLLAIVFFFTSALSYSQAAAVKTLMPTALVLNVSPLTAAAFFTAVSGLFILLTYPMLVAAVQMDDMGTTRIGKSAFNHSLFTPGTLGVALAVCLGFVLGSSIL